MEITTCADTIVAEFINQLIAIMAASNAKNRNRPHSEEASGYPDHHLLQLLALNLLFVYFSHSALIFQLDSVSSSVRPLHELFRFYNCLSEISLASQFQLFFYQIVICTFRFNKLSMCTFLNKPPFFKYNNLIGVLNRA